MSEKPVSMATTTIIITKVYPGPGGGGVIKGLDTSGNRLSVIADGQLMPTAPVKGSVWRFTGRIRRHPVHGDQLHLSSCEMVKPTEGFLIIHLKTHPAFRGFGLGDKKIDKLNETFANELGSILESGEADSLAQVLPQEVAQKLIEAWRAQGEESSVVAFLNKHGVDTRLARKIIKFWGEQAVEKLRENPYRLLIMTSWEVADRLARRLGIASDSRHRLVAATEAWLYKRLDQHKDTLTDPENLKQGIRTLLGRDADHLTKAAIGAALEETAIIGDDSFGYQQVGCVVMERTLTLRFYEMLQADPMRVKASEVDRLIDDFERQEGIKLNDEQRDAVQMTALQPLSVLCGGAGVGKTTVLKAIHRIAGAMKVSVYQMALAGRAAQRMREATNEDAYTIIGFLNRMQHGKILPKAGDLIVIDESSMLDLILTYNLFKALPKGVRLLTVGDHHQLPPIGPGLVFHRLVESTTVPVVELIQVHRQAAATGIPQVAKQVRDGKLPELSEYEGRGSGVHFIEANEESIVDHFKVILSDLGGFHETQILGVTKSGCAGVKEINNSFHREMTVNQPRLDGWGLAETDPIIYTTNDYERELFNGSLGRIEKVFPDASLPDTDEESAPRRARATFDGREVDLSDDDLGNVELAYAITTHKAQGSQFRRVVVPITKSRLLDRTLVYTALTRGVEQVIFVGDKRTFEESIVNPPSASLRRVGLSI